jgi:DNA (cytosine-5)-methyltransferase 1
VPDCISITKRHFPNMKHLGDITKINGADIEPVDIITFGSPCQDLSIAGKRAGLNGLRSGLFRKAVRIIKEMRGKTNGACPRYAVWENVHGAFSSNKGYDFLSVLDELSAIAEPEISIPRPPQRDGGAVWSNAGTVVGDGWSLAWRVLDAQYWGVPHRRRRIFLIADFAGGRAGEIFFKPESVSGNSSESGKAGQGTAGNTESGVRAAGFNGWRSVTGTLEYEDDRAPCMQSTMPPNVVTQKQYAVDFGRVADRIQMYPEKAVTLQGEGGGCGAKTGLYCLPVAVHQNQNGEGRAGKVANTLNTNGNASGRNAPLVAIGIDSEMNSLADKMGTMRAHESGGMEQFVATFAMQGFGDYKPADCASSLKSRDGKDSTDLITNNYSVRRLTPLECERLQGFPDGWTEYGHDGKKISDSARYRALGNSLAIPCVLRVLGGIK